MIKLTYYSLLQKLQHKQSTESLHAVANLAKSLSPEERCFGFENCVSERVRRLIPSKSYQDDRL